MPHLIPHVDSIELDSYFSKDNLEEQKKKGKREKPVAKGSLTLDSNEDPAHPRRPFLDGDFKVILLDKDPYKGVNICTNLLERKS